MTENAFVADHPLIRDAVSRLRETATPPSTFRTLTRRIAMLLAAEATRDLPVAKTRIETPLEVIDDAPVITAPPVVVSILRAGNGMADGVLDLIPDSPLGHIGMYRNEDLEAVEYYFRLPDVTGRHILVVDPMLATAGTAVAALTRLSGLGQASTRLLAVIAAPEGLAHLAAHHPDVKVYVGALDRQLNEKGYILPGLGDAGDRLYGTEH